MRFAGGHMDRHQDSPFERVLLVFPEFGVFILFAAGAEEDFGPRLELRRLGEIRQFAGIEQDHPFPQAGCFFSQLAHVFRFRTRAEKENLTWINCRVIFQSLVEFENIVRPLLNAVAPIVAFDNGDISAAGRHARLEHRAVDGIAHQCVPEDQRVFLVGVKRGGRKDDATHIPAPSQIEGCVEGRDHSGQGRRVIGIGHDRVQALAFHVELPNPRRWDVADRTPEQNLFLIRRDPEPAEVSPLEQAVHLDAGCIHEHQSRMSGLGAGVGEFVRADPPGVADPALYNLVGFGAFCRFRIQPPHRIAPIFSAGDQETARVPRVREAGHPGQLGIQPDKRCGRGNRP